MTRIGHEKNFIVPCDEGDGDGGDGDRDGGAGEGACGGGGQHMTASAVQVGHSD